ncbi:MAG: hypothetical protein NTZ85_05150 [Bacteroidia bacterium]|jgi:hypothetical protein|nr:hypothetical protein [Bacteroidia bacterium]
MIKFKFEHHRQEVLPLPKFLLRLSKYLLFSLILIAFSLLLGILGYHYFGKLNLLDSFHMSSMILTGMGPVEEMTTTSAKIFSSIFALYSGIAFLSITAVFFAPIIHRILHILHVEGNNETK